MASFEVKLKGFEWKGRLMHPGQIPDEVIGEIEEQAKIPEEQETVVIIGKRQDKGPLRIEKNREKD